MDQRTDWWRYAIFYQVYPRSFQDSDGDGVGDIRGIIRRLPYLKSLGVDAVWLSPIFPSPMADFGYDISDYTGIDPLFGTMDDFDALVEAADAKASRSYSIWCRTTPPISIRGLSKAAPRATIPNATGTSGGMAGPRADRRTTGCRNSAAAPGNMMKRPGSITTMHFSPNSRT
jgi:hypothetical protein